MIEHDVRGDCLNIDDVVDGPAGDGPWLVISPRETYFGERTVGVVHMITGKPKHFGIFTEFTRFSAGEVPRR
jgi:hypothetical protein